MQKVGHPRFLRIRRQDPLDSGKLTIRYRGAINSLSDNLSAHLRPRRIRFKRSEKRKRDHHKERDDEKEDFLVLPKEI